MKPTKLCRMVKTMLHFAIKLFLDNADLEFVIQIGATYARFQNYCTNDKESLVLVANLTDKTKF